jgi:serine/threonine protein kinase
MSLAEPSFRFTPLAKIASGGSATVYVGRGARDSVLVALKRPHAHVLEDERQRAALLREAALAASFRHPNIVGVRLVETNGANLQLVMDYVEGSALGALLVLAAKDDGRIPARVAARIILDAALGLHAVHEHQDRDGRALGLLHRDVSPQNILVGIDGIAKLTDFGIAKAVYDGSSSTTQGTLKGKLGYMAPEYVNRGEQGRAIDVFALGVVLWEALAGRRLFRGDNEAQTLDRILHADAPSLSRVAPELRSFESVVRTALTKDPRDRFPTAEAMAHALEAAALEAEALATHDEVAAYVKQAAMPELARVRAAVGQAEKDLARRKARPWGWSLAAAALLAGGFALGMQLTHPSTPAPLAPASAAAPPSNASQAVEPPPPAPASPASSEAIELDPSPSTTNSAQRPRVPGPHQPPPNPYLHRSPR